MGRYETLDESDPDVAAEWHPTKNGDLTPADVTGLSNRWVWWQCARGHEWEGAINQRTRRKSPTSCPYCSFKAELGRRFPSVMKTDSRMDVYLFMAANSRRYDDLYIGTVREAAKQLGHSERNEKKLMADLMRLGLVEKLGNRCAYVVRRPKDVPVTCLKDKERELFEHLLLGSHGYANVFVGERADIREGTRYSMQTVKRSLHDLMDVGVVEKVAGGVYLVNDARRFG